MGADLFVDTSGWYALLDRRDPVHDAIRKTLAVRLGEGTRLVTTDYVIDETCTLTKVRAGAHASQRFLHLVGSTAALRIEWVAPERFETAKAYFEWQLDHGYSFTDCSSFVLMRELELLEVLTTDVHFEKAGFVILPAQD